MFDIICAVKHVCSEDIRQLVEISQLVILDGGAIGWTNAIDAHELASYWETTAEKVRKGACVLAIAETTSQIIGTAQLHVPLRPEHSTAGHAGTLSKVFVHPNFRRLGIGRELLRCLEDEAKVRGLTTIELSVRINQIGAIGLYESLGYSRWGEQPYYAKLGLEYFSGYHYVKVIGDSLNPTGEQG